jgi:hypothetical protein
MNSHVPERRTSPCSPTQAWVIIKKMFRRFLLFMILLLWIPACTPAVPTSQPVPIPKTVLLPENTPIPAQPSLTLSPIPTFETTPTPAPPPNTRYSMEMVFDYAARRIAVTQSIDYANLTSLSLKELLLKIEPANYPGVFELKSVSWSDGDPVEETAWEGAVLRIPLPEPLQPGAVHSLALVYELTLPRMVENDLVRPPIFGYTDRQINLVDWYPFIPPYTEEGWMVHPRGHYGEHLTYDIADYELKLKISNAPANLVVAASGPQEVVGEWLRYRLPAARNFVFSLSPDYQVMQGTAGDVTVYSYGFPLHGIANAAVLQTTIDALILYQELFGPYPHTTMSAVEADFLDGMEYDGLYYLSRGFYNLYSDSPSDYLIAIAAHETAHQWWYALIGNNQAIEPWLDEALCTYMEHIYFERYAPEALNWWWNYRVKYYEPRGLIDVSIYDKHGDFQSYRDYRDAVYLNGAVFLHELRTEIGDEAFFAFLKDYAARHTGGIATSTAFFDVLAEHTEQDLTPLIQKYFKD